MMLFSSKARRVLDDAVDLLMDERQRVRWRLWSVGHPQTLQPGGPAEDGGGPLPRDIAAIALAALEAKARQLRGERDRVPSDEAFVFDNDLSLIRSIEVMLIAARDTVHA